jgi:hypothetical protein
MVRGAIAAQTEGLSVGGRDARGEVRLSQQQETILLGWCNEW